MSRLFLEVARQELKKACGFPYIVFRLDIDFEMTISIRAYGLYSGHRFFCADMCFTFTWNIIKGSFYLSIDLEARNILACEMTESTTL